MHISEGVLSPSILLGGAVVTLIGLAIGLKNLKEDKLPEVAILSSTFFVASLIHIPIGPSSAHLILNGLVGILLGWVAFLAIFLGLLLQAILFQFGGITTLGINTLNMAFPSVIMWYFFKNFVSKINNIIFIFIVGFLSGFLSVIFSAILVSLSLYFTQKSFFALIITLMSIHIPIAIIEGLITGFILVYLKKVKPEVLL